MPAPVARPAPDGNVSPSVTPKDDVGADAGQNVVLRAKKRWDYANSVDSENRDQEEQDLRFARVKGEQREDNARRERDRQKRPWLEFNQTRQFIKRVVNEIRQSRPSISIRPTGAGANQQKADIRSALIRHIEYDSSADQSYDSAAEQACTSGRGYLRVYAEYETPTSANQKLKIASIPSPLSVLMDPDCVMPDKSDAKYCFVTEYIDKDTFTAEWGEAAAASISWDNHEDEYAYMWQGNKVCVADYYEVVEQDMPLLILPNGQGVWLDDPAVKQAMDAGLPVMTMQTEKRKRRRVDWYKLSASDKPLAEYEWRGKYIPIVMMVGDQMNVAGMMVYKGLVRDIRDAQMMYNYWFTSATERVALAPKAPYIAMAGQLENHDEWNTANTQNHSKMEYNPIELADGSFFTAPPQRSPGPEMPAAMLQMCQSSADLLRQITGIKEANLAEATQPHEPGIALLNRQQQGDTITFNFPDNCRNAIRLVGLIVNDLIQYVYDADRIVPQLGIDGEQTQVRINQKAPPLQGLPPVMNDITVGDFDVVVDVGPSYLTRRLQASNEINDFIQLLGPNVAPLAAPAGHARSQWTGRMGWATRWPRFARAALPPAAQAIINGGKSQDPQVAALQGQVQQMQQQMQQMNQQFQQASQKSAQQMQDKDNEIAKLNLSVMNNQRDYNVSMNEMAIKKYTVDETSESERARADVDLIIAKLNDGTKKMELFLKGLSTIPQLAQLFSTVDQGVIDAPVEPQIAGGPHVRTGDQTNGM